MRVPGPECVSASGTRSAEPAGLLFPDCSRGEPPWFKQAPHSKHLAGPELPRTNLGPLCGSFPKTARGDSRSASPALLCKRLQGLLHVFCVIIMNNLMVEEEENQM